MPSRVNAEVSENTLPFVSQSINNFSDYDISQSVDWECPSLSPHVLLRQPKARRETRRSLGTRKKGRART